MQEIPITYPDLYRQYINTETIRSSWIAPAVVITTLALSIILCGGIACLLRVNLAVTVVLPSAIALIATIPLWIKAKRYPNHLPALVDKMVAQLAELENVAKKWNKKTEKQAMNNFLSTMDRQLFPNEDSFLRKKSLSEALKRKIKDKQTSRWSETEKSNVCANVDAMVNHKSPYTEAETD